MRTRSMVRRVLVGGIVLTILAAVPASGALSRFLDVSDTNTFVNDIEWMADTGVTNGCGPDLYCPNDPVTRGQMAAFTHRLSVNKVVDAATAVTADSATTAGHAATADSATTATSADDSVLLDGRAPATYDTFVIGDARFAADGGGQMGLCGSVELPHCPTAFGDLLAEANFTTLAAHSMMAVTGTTTLWATGPADPTSVYVWLQMDSSACTDSINAQATGAYSRQRVTVNEEESVSITAVFEIPTAGAHSVALCGQPFAGNLSVLTSNISGVVSASPSNSRSQTITPA